MKEWFTTTELAGLPGLPSTDRNVRARAKREQWQSRPRAASGGGREYHISSLPAETRAALLLREKRRTAAASDEPAAPSAERERSQALWEQWEAKPASIKAEAQRRFDALLAVQQLIADGEKKLDAYAIVAEQIGESVSTIRNWLRRVQDVHQGDWLPHLAPRWTGRTATAEYDEQVYQWFRDLYLHPSRPPYTLCYERVCRIAAEHGLEVPSLATLKRDLERREDPVVVVLEREGEAAARRLYPYLERSRASFRALEALNADGHVLDLDTVWPDGERCRTTLIGFQDLYSGALVGYRLAKSESAHELGLAFLGVCDQWGVPEHLWVDNTLAMASKRMTAGAKGRKRFRDQEGDPLGVLPMLGVQVHFVLPRSGQSKPIERPFRDLADRISKHPAFTGAYLGNNPLNKPHNYGKRTIPVEELAKIVEQEILAHNYQTGRRTEVCQGRLSFWEAFEASYREHAHEVRRLTAAQRRLLYLVADTVRVDHEGCIRLFGNRYWSEETVRLRGQKVVVRYHPTERMLHDAIYVYALNGDYLGEVPCYHKAGFADAEAAERHNRARRQFLRAKKQVAAARRQLEAAEVAELVPDLEPPELAAAVGDDVVRADFRVPSTLERLAATQVRARERDQAETRVSASLERAAALLQSQIERRT